MLTSRFAAAAMVKPVGGDSYHMPLDPWRNADIDAGHILAHA